MSKKPLTIKDPKIFIFLLPFVAIVSMLVNVDNNTALEFEANGKVVMAKWNTTNHGMCNVPLYFGGLIPTYLR